MRKQGKNINGKFTPAPDGGRGVIGTGPTGKVEGSDFTKAPDGGRGVIGPGVYPSQPKDATTNPPRKPPKK